MPYACLTCLRGISNALLFLLRGVPFGASMLFVAVSSIGALIDIDFGSRRLLF